MVVMVKNKIDDSKAEFVIPDFHLKHDLVTCPSVLVMFIVFKCERLWCSLTSALYYNIVVFVRNILTVYVCCVKTDYNNFHSCI